MSFITINILGFSRDPKEAILEYLGIIFGKTLVVATTHE
jgi:hypothetical protein